MDGRRGTCGAGAAAGRADALPVVFPAPSGDLIRPGVRLGAASDELARGARPVTREAPPSRRRRPGARGASARRTPARAAKPASSPYSQSGGCGTGSATRAPTARPKPTVTAASARTIRASCRRVAPTCRISAARASVQRSPSSGVDHPDGAERGDQAEQEHGSACFAVAPRTSSRYARDSGAVRTAPPGDRARERPAAGRTNARSSTGRSRGATRAGAAGAPRRSRAAARRSRPRAAWPACRRRARRYPIADVPAEVAGRVGAGREPVAGQRGQRPALHAEVEDLRSVAGSTARAGAARGSPSAAAVTDVANVPEIAATPGARAASATRPGGRCAESRGSST